MAEAKGSQSRRQPPAPEAPDPGSPPDPRSPGDPRPPGQPFIRRLGDDDSITELTLLLHRAYRQLLEQGMRYNSTHQSAAVTRSRIAGGECYVAVLHGRIVGTILYQEAGATGGCPYYERTGVASFHQFGVDPDRQGSGLGARLLDVVEARAMATGARELALDTAEAATQVIEMYTRRGYRIVDTHDWGDTNYGSVIMARTVSRQG